MSVMCSISFLKKKGFEATLAQNGKAGLGMLRSDKCGLILIDLIMAPYRRPHGRDAALGGSNFLENIHIGDARRTLSSDSRSA